MQIHLECQLVHCFHNHVSAWDMPGSIPMGLIFVAAVSLGTAATSWAAATEGPVLPLPSNATLQSAYGRVPLSFEANHGQTDPQVQFLTRGRDHALFLTPNAAVLTVQSGEATDKGRGGGATQHRMLNNSTVCSPITGGVLCSR